MEAWSLGRRVLLANFAVALASIVLVLFLQYLSDAN